MSDHDWDPRFVDDEDEPFEGSGPDVDTAVATDAPASAGETGSDGSHSIAEVRKPVRGRRRSAAALGLVAALAVAALAGWWLMARGGLPADAVLAVDGETVTEDELASYTDMLRAVYGVERPGDEGARDQFRRDVATSMALSLVIEELAESRGVDVTEDEARAALDDFIDQRYPDSGRDAFVDALGTRGVSEAQVLAEVRRQLLTSRLFDHVVGDVQVTEAEIAAAYEQLEDELRRPETRALRHIVTATREDAQAALARLEGGEDFDAVAAEVSLDGSTRDEGGRLGTLSRGDLTAGFADAAFEAGAGELFGPVETELGWHVGRVDHVKPTRTPSLDDVREQLRTRLELDAALARWRPWLADRFAEAHIIYAEEYEPEDPTRLPGDDVAPLLPRSPQNGMLETEVPTGSTRP